MSGRRFVLALVVLAAGAVAAIALGVPSWGEPAGAGNGGAASGETDPTPSAADRPDGPRHTDREPASGARRADDATHRAAVDERVTTSADTAAAWPYRRTAVADLDADAVPERLVVASDVYVNADGEPMWGDVQRWAVFVEEDEGTRTLVYSASAPPGGVAAAVGAVTEAGPRRIVVIEQGPRDARFLLALYEGPGRTRLTGAADAVIEEWVDRVAEETTWTD